MQFWLVFDHHMSTDQITAAASPETQFSFSPSVSLLQRGLRILLCLKPCINQAFWAQFKAKPTMHHHHDNNRTYNAILLITSDRRYKQ